MNNIMICDEVDIMNDNENKKIISERCARGLTYKCISTDMNISINSINSILNGKSPQ